MECFALLRLARLELDGSSIMHLHEAQIGIGNTELMPGVAVGGDDKCSILFRFFFAVDELHLITLLANAARASHTPPICMKKSIEEWDIDVSQQLGKKRAGPS